MADRLNSKTTAAIESLCRKISVAYELDAEIQEELRGHVEDKLLGYLDGEETLSEDDAFILVREHFGDPAKVKSLLREVHTYESHASVARYIAAALIVTTAMGIIGHYATAAIHAVWPVHYLFFTVTRPVFAVLALLVSWILLRHWQRRLHAGATPWFLTWRPMQFAASIALLTVLLLHASTLPIFMLLNEQSQAISSPSIVILYLYMLIAVQVFHCILWLWWCDRPPRNIRTISNAAGVWAIWTLLSSTISDIGNASSWVRLDFTAELAVDMFALQFGYLVIIALVAVALYRYARYAAAIRQRSAIARRQ